MSVDTRGWLRSRVLLNERIRETKDDELSFLIHYWGASPEHGDNVEHKHSFFEACYVVEGEGTYMERGQTFPLRKGTLFLSRPGIVHQIRSPGMPLLFVAFEVIAERSAPYWNDRFAKTEQCERFVLYDADETPAALLWRALHTQAQSAADAAAVAQTGSLAHILLASFAQAFGEESAEAPEPDMPYKASAPLRQATLFIRDNLREPLRMEEVAGYLHMSGRHLSRLFANELGMTFTEFLRKARVDESARLLRESELSIKQIAEETGFGSVHYFTRVFTDATGMTPGRYRGVGQRGRKKPLTK